MALVPITHVYDTLSVINNTGLLDGQILYTTDQTVNKIFADVKVNGILRRIEIGGTNTIDTVLDQDSGHAIANSAVAKLAQTVHTNLLNPTLQTTTVNEVTCTANGDGTYTLNGKSTAQPGFILCTVRGLSGKHKLIGCPSGGGQYTFNISYRVDDVWSSKYETGNGLEIDCDPTKTYQFEFVIRANQTLNNVTFKPMLTTDLSATYNDFVPYSGNGELNENVSDLYKNLNTTNSNLTALDTKVGAQSLLPTPSQSVTQNINTLKAEINRLNDGLGQLNIDTLRIAVVSGTVPCSSPDNNTIGYKTTGASAISISSLSGFPSGDGIVIEGYSIEMAYVTEVAENCCALLNIGSDGKIYANAAISGNVSFRIRIFYVNRNE